MGFPSLSICEDKRRAVEVTWYTAMAVSVAYVIAALVVAARLHKSDMPTGVTQPTAFAAIWSMILLVLILVGGTVVFRRIQTPIATGVFLGCVAMYSQIELMLFAIFQSRSRQASDAGEASACGAIAAFSFFLAIIFGVFTVFLTLWRQHVPAVAGPSMDSYA